MQKYNVYLCDDYRVKNSDIDVLLLASACLSRHQKMAQKRITCHTQDRVIDSSKGYWKCDVLNKYTVFNPKVADHYDRNSVNYLSNTTQPCRKKSFFTWVNSYFFTLIFFAMSSAQVAAQSLADSDLNNQSLYASGYITAGARTTVGGNVQSATAVTLAANAIFAGNVEAGAATTLGADAGVVGYIEAGSTVTLGVAAVVNGFIQTGTTATVGASSIIDGSIIAGTTATFDTLVEVTGDVLGGTTVTVGAGSVFHGNVDAGTTTTIGAGVQIDGILTANSLLVPPLPC